MNKITFIQILTFFFNPISSPLYKNSHTIVPTNSYKQISANIYIALDREHQHLHILITPNCYKYSVSLDLASWMRFKFSGPSFVIILRVRPFFLIWLLLLPLHVASTCLRLKDASCSQVNFELPRLFGTDRSGLSRCRSAVRSSIVQAHSD